jgi:hypothetical protein
MKKKTTKKKKPVKQKIDAILESLLNLEQRTKELIKRVEELERLTFSLYYKDKKDNNKYWPNIPVPEYKEITWTYTKPVVGIDDEGKPIVIDSWDNKVTKSINNE